MWVRQVRTDYPSSYSIREHGHFLSLLFAPNWTLRQHSCVLFDRTDVFQLVTCWVKKIEEWWEEGEKRKVRSSSAHIQIQTEEFAVVVEKLASWDAGGWAGKSGVRASRAERFVTARTSQRVYQRKIHLISTTVATLNPVYFYVCLHTFNICTHPLNLHHIHNNYM